MAGGQRGCPHKDCLAAVAQTFPNNSSCASLVRWPYRNQSAKPITFVDCRLPPTASAARGKTGIKLTGWFFAEITTIALTHPKRLTISAILGLFQNNEFSEPFTNQVLLLATSAAYRIEVQMPGSFVCNIAAVTLPQSHWHFHFCFSRSYSSAVNFPKRFPVRSCLLFVFGELEDSASCFIRRPPSCVQLAYHII